MSGCRSPMATASGDTITINNGGDARAAAAAYTEAYRWLHPRLLAAPDRGRHDARSPRATMPTFSSAAPSTPRAPLRCRLRRVLHHEHESGQKWPRYLGRPDDLDRRHRRWHRGTRGSMIALVAADDSLFAQQATQRPSSSRRRRACLDRQHIDRYRHAADDLRRRLRLLPSTSADNSQRSSPRELHALQSHYGRGTR